MDLLSRMLAFAFALCALAFSNPASAQIAGRCVLPDGFYDIWANGSTVHVNNGAFMGVAERDPSGQSFLQLPSGTPLASFWIDWGGGVIKKSALGLSQVGTCQFDPRFVPPPPQMIYLPPTPQPNYGFMLPGGQIFQVPSALADLNNPYGRPLFVTEKEATNCAEQDFSVSDSFKTCMVKAMLGDREYQTLKCAQDEPAAAARAFCMVGALGGANERVIASRLQDCHHQYGENWRMYSVCLASDQMSNDQVRLLNCVAQEYQQTGSVNLMSTAVCYGGNQLNLNPEAQIIVGCAASTGGEPEAFVGCAGGELSAREFDKCLTDGVGGDDGCFGNNNSIFKALGASGDRLAAMLGQNNETVKLWRATVEDIMTGRTTARLGAVALKNAANEGNRAVTNVYNEASKVGGNVQREAKKGYDNVRREAGRAIKRFSPF